MIEWEATEVGIRVIDHADMELPVRAAGWTPCGADATVDRPTDETVAGTTTELELPEAHVHAATTDGEVSVEMGSETGPVELPAGDYLLNVSTNIKTYVRFDGPVTLEKSADFERLRISFPGPTDVVLGFRSYHDRPAGTVTVPPTPAGVAEGVSFLHSSMKTTDPERSFPTLRGHPPRLEIGETLDVPEGIAETTEDTGIALRAPSELGDVFVLAPLSFYLQAELTVEAGADPVLEIPSAGVEHPLGAEDLQAGVADLLRRVFFLDCLVRTAGSFGTNLAETEALEATPLDGEWAYDAAPDERLAAYLDLPDGAIDRWLPDWHLSTSVKPELERARCLPFLLAKLSLVYLPESSEMEGSELIRHSLDDFFRAAPESPVDRPDLTRGSDAVASVDVLKPELGAGRLHGWLADGVPIDVFKSSYEAFENRFDYLARGGDGIQVSVVLNDESMESEHDEVARIYRERAGELPIDVEVRDHLPRAELAAVFEAENDFVHYIGHCEESGLRCPDGTLPVDDIEASNTQTFFLNACGSYHEGMSLIEKGSVVGAVTFTKVLDKQAATVGTTFARLLANGFSFARAMQLARQRVMTGKDYAVIGDGTHAFTQSSNQIPLVLEVEKEGEGYRMTADVYTPANPGGFYQVNVAGDERSHLFGNASTYEIGEEYLVDYLERASAPVIMDGEHYWSSELADRLGA